MRGGYILLGLRLEVVLVSHEIALGEGDARERIDVCNKMNLFYEVKSVVRPDEI